MKLATMWKDAVESLVNKPATEQYPFTRTESPERLRGNLHWDPESCTGCGLCAKDCPANAIEVFVVDRKAKRFVFRYNVDCCTFCAQCVASCRQGCLEMDSEDWELAALSKGDFVSYWGEEADVESVLAEPSA